MNGLKAVVLSLDKCHVFVYTLNINSGNAAGGIPFDSIQIKPQSIFNNFLINKNDKKIMGQLYSVAINEPSIKFYSK